MKEKMDELAEKGITPYELAVRYEKDAGKTLKREELGEAVQAARKVLREQDEK